MKYFTKKILLVILFLGSGLSLAQPKIDLKYYVNNTSFPIEDIKIFLVTKSDTIVPKIEKGKIMLSDGFNENFSLFAKIDERIIKIGTYRPSMFNEIDGIAVGRITDFSTIKKYWQWDNAYFIDDEYVVIIPDAANILDVIYCSVRKDENVSLISDVRTWAPTYTFTHEVIAKKKVIKL